MQEVEQKGELAPHLGVYKSSSRQGSAVRLSIGWQGGENDQTDMEKLGMKKGDTVWLSAAVLGG